METINKNLNSILSNNIQNRTNFNNNIINPSQIIINNKINNYPNSNYIHRTPKDIETNTQINNVHLNFGNNTKQNHQINEINNILNDQNINILNMDLIPRNTNSTPKIIIQKIINKEQNLQNNYNPNLTDNNLMNDKKNDMKSPKKNKEKKSNYQYIIKNVKKVNQILKSEKKEFNGLGSNESKKEEKGEININQIREELRLIHDNRKYNYDKKVQKINPGKIPIPQGKKLVERILGLNENRKNKEEEKTENKNIIEFKTTSKFDEQTIPEYKIPKEIIKKEQIINNKNIGNISPINSRQNIKFSKSENNIKVVENKENQPQIIKNPNQITNINNQNIINQQYIKNIYQENQIKQIQKILNNDKTNSQILAENNHINQLHGILIPPPTNNNDLQNAKLLPYQQIINKNQQKTLTIIQKLSPKKTNKKNILKSKPNLENINPNINNIQLYNTQNNMDSIEIDSDEPKNSDEINDKKEKPYINKDIGQKINITVKKISPIISQQRLNMSPMKGYENIIQNRHIIHPNLKINYEQIQNMGNIRQKNIYEVQVQKLNINSDQNTNIINYNNNIFQNNNNPNKDTNNMINPNFLLNNQNTQIINNNPLNINPLKQMNNKENKNNNLALNNFNNNINNNIQQKQNIYANVQKIPLQQIPNNTIIGNIIIKEGKTYYINPSPNPNLKPNYNNIHQQNSLKQQNIQIPNQINQNIIYKQIINNQIIYRDQYGNIINFSNPQQQMNNNTQFKKYKNVVKKKQLSRVTKLLQSKDSNDRKPTLQYKIERKRPVYAVPPHKKRSVSQGKPFTLINKYYDENYILEDDEETDEKNEENQNIGIEKNVD